MTSSSTHPSQNPGSHPRLHTCKWISLLNWLVIFPICVISPHGLHPILVHFIHSFIQQPFSTHLLCTWQCTGHLRILLRKPKNIHVKHGCAQCLGLLPHPVYPESTEWDKSNNWLGAVITELACQDLDSRTVWKFHEMILTEVFGRLALSPGRTVPWLGSTY